MDLILNYLDPRIIDHVYDLVRGSLQLALCPTSYSSSVCPVIADSKLWYRKSIYRQSLSIFIVTWSVHWPDIVEFSLIQINGQGF
jgi:hypothetical protein